MKQSLEQARKGFPTTHPKCGLRTIRGVRAFAKPGRNGRSAANVKEKVNALAFTEQVMYQDAR